MDKLKFTGFVIGAMIIYYLFLSVLIPLLVSTSGDAAATIEAGTHASDYVASVAGLRYAPLFLYFVPAIIAIVVIVLKLGLRDRFKR